MKSKFVLALDLLEREVEVLSKEQQTQFIGGDDYGSNGYESNGYSSDGYLSNGYCFFNNITYMGIGMPGGAGAGLSMDPQHYIDQYIDRYGEADFQYDGNDLMGLSNNNNMFATLNRYFTTNPISSASTTDTANGVNSALANGNKVSAVLKTGTMGGVTTGHDVAIISQNGSTYTYFDTFLNNGRGGTATANLSNFNASKMVEITGLRDPLPTIP